MALDPRFICSSDLEGIFRDKLTGLPLAAGKIYFYSDYSRTIPKAVYQLTGSPPSGFAALPNPLTLSGIGSYQDSGGNNIVIYYLPFKQTVDGDIATTTDEQELYYISVFNSDNVPQFTRDDWPPLAVNLSPTNDSVEGFRNYIPNGQFLAHNNVPITDVVPPNDVLEIAPGGWSFKETTGGTGNYAIAFNAETNSPGGAITDFPPFSVNISSAGSGTETVRDLTIQWPNVNTFSKDFSSPATNIFNLFFAARSNTASTQTIDIRLIQNYGVGSSDAESDTSVATKPVNSSTDGYGLINQNITFPDNVGKDVQSQSFVAIAIRMPPGVAFNMRFTDFALTIGATELVRVPTQTNAQTLSQGIAGWMPTPNPDGSDLYLPLILGPSGVLFDTGQIGEIFGSLSHDAPIGNNLLMDGTAYFFSQYSVTPTQSVSGIPFRRLGNFLTVQFASFGPTDVYPVGFGLPLFGSGTSFINAYGVMSQPTQFLLVINAGAGVSPIPAIGTAPVTLTTNADPDFTFTLNSVPTAGQYFTFSAPVAAPQAYYVWFRIDGGGTDPMPGGIGLVVDLITGDTVATSVVKIMHSINQYIFFIPNLAGYFLRGFDPTGILDTNFNTRVIASLGFTGGIIGSTETDLFESHTHPGSVGGQGSTASPGANACLQSVAPTAFTQTLHIAADGGGETRPYNFAVNWYIKY